MIFEETGIDGLLICKPQVHKDDRGYFLESYNHSVFNKNNLNYTFLQDNEARSSYGVVRGLHMQTGIYSQAKLIRAIKGAIYDVALDLRPDSATFGQWFGIELNEENHFQLLIPRGFAHGYSSLQDETIIVYKCDNVYNKASEAGVRLDDPELNIDWKIPVDLRIISSKDRELPFLNQIFKSKEQDTIS